MTAEEIKQIINDEIISDPDVINYFGDLTDHLLEPKLQNYKRSNDATEVYQLWTVFEERLDKNGYKIYYDEKENLFGLALNSDSEELINIGLYGSFLRTLYTM